MLLIRLPNYLFPGLKVARGHIRVSAAVARSRVLHRTSNRVFFPALAHEEADEYAFLFSSGNSILHSVAGMASGSGLVTSDLLIPESVFVPFMFSLALGTLELP